MRITRGEIIHPLPRKNAHVIDSLSTISLPLSLSLSASLFFSCIARWRRRASAPPRFAFVSLARALVVTRSSASPFFHDAMRDTGATVLLLLLLLLMMREEASAIKRAELSATTTAAAVRLLPTSSSSSFFLPRYLRLPDICTRRTVVEARPSHVGEKAGQHTYTPRLLCTGECEVSAHRGVTQPHDSPIR